jgi:hypothetical protein
MVQTKTNQIEKLEQLHQLVTNEVNHPKLMAFLKKHNIVGPEDLENKIKESFGFVPFGVEHSFLDFCILNDDFEAFLYEYNGNYYGDTDEVLSSESDWERYTQNILNVINK